MKNPMVNLNEERQKDIAAMQNPENVRSEFKGLTLEQCQEKCASDRLPFDACFLNITSDLNVSASILTVITRNFVLPFHYTVMSQWNISLLEMVQLR